MERKVLFEDCLKWPLVVTKRLLCILVINLDQFKLKFKYYINHIIDHFHELVENNLQWWEDCGVIEHAAVEIKEK